MDRRLMMRLFVPLYASQFLGIGFLFTALVAINRDGGGSLAEGGAIYVLGLVWAAKFLWAPLVDRFGSRRYGHYRSWLLVTQPLSVLLLLAIVPFDVVDDLGIILAALALVAFSSATQDIATDALAVRATHGGSRGGVNGVQVGANFVGDIVGGGLVLIIYGVAGWVPAVLTLAALTAVPFFFVVRHREPVGELLAVAEKRIRRGSVLSLLRTRGAARWLFVLNPVLTIGVSGAYVLLVPMLIDAGMAVGLVGVLTNVVGGLISIGAAVGAGLLLNRIGRKRALIGYAVGQVIAIVAMVPLADGSGLAWTVAVVVVFNVFNAAMWTVMYAVNMDFSRPDNAGSDFTVQVSISLFIRFAAAGFLLGLAETTGYVNVLWICVGAGLVGVVAVAMLYREHLGTAADPAIGQAPTAELSPA
ncbi:MAG: MFS transporter [Pseudonocardiaceae bacterium]|nr:MFS transporter [Pseudonocardiaceae bacterium]